MFDRHLFDTEEINKKSGSIIIDKISSIAIGVKLTASRLVFIFWSYVISLINISAAALPKINNNTLAHAFINIASSFYINRQVFWTRTFISNIFSYIVSNYITGFVRVFIKYISNTVTAARQVFWTRTSSLAIKVTGGWILEEGFYYRKRVAISNSGALKTYFPVRFLIGESSGSAGCDFHLDGNCKTDFADLRFTTDDKVTINDHWVESITGTSPNQVAAVWIEISSIAATPSLTNFYVYFGNPSAVSTSSGEDTFLFFDHFEGTSLDTEKWTPYIGARNGYIIVENSYVKIQGEIANPLVNQRESSILSIPTFTEDVAWYAKLMMGVGNEWRGGELNDGTTYMGGANRVSWGHYPWTGSPGTEDYFQVYASSDGRQQQYHVSPDTNQTRYARILLLRGNEATFHKGTSAWTNDISTITESTTLHVPTSSAQLKSGIFVQGWNISNTIWCDYNFVTKYSATTPAFNSVGSAEAGGTANSSYHYGTARLASSIVGLFMDMWGEGILRVRHAAIAIGAKLYEPFRRISVSYYLNPIIGAKVTAVNFWRIINSAVTIGITSATSYLWSICRPSIVKIGNKISASRTAFISRISQVYIGFKLIVKQYYFINSYIYVALSIPYAFGLKNFKVAVKAIGEAITATRTIFLTRISAVIIGVKVNGYNIHHYFGSAAVAIGFVAHYALVFFVNVRKASIKIAVSLYMVGASWFQHKLIEEAISIADSILSIFAMLAYTESITFTDYPPIEYKNLPKFWLEVRNDDGELLAILENAFDVTIIETIDEFDAIRLSLPSNDVKAEYLTPSNWIWVHQQGVPLKIFKIYKQADKR